jgi:hypothetical protein
MFIAKAGGELKTFGDRKQERIVHFLHRAETVSENFRRGNFSFETVAVGGQVAIP